MLLLAAGGLLWLLPARSSFWLDETATFWVIKDGLGPALTRPMYWSGQSPVYSLIAWLALQVGGKSELVLRIPSLAAMAGAAWLLFRLAERLFDRRVAMSAVIVFMCYKPVAFAACDARPYAVGLFFLAGTALLLVHWLDTGRQRSALGYSLFAALTVYLHYLLASALAVLAVYGLYRVARENRHRIWTLAAAWAGTALLMLPLTMQFLRFYQNRTNHSFGGSPKFIHLLSAAVPPAIAIPVLVAVLSGWFLLGRRKQGGDSEKPNVALAAIWAAVPPLVCFLISVFTDTGIFIPRYYIAAAPALALLAGLALRSTTSAVWRIATAAIFVVAVVSFGARFHTIEDWSGAMSAVRSITGTSQMPVLMASGFIEASDPQALEDPRLREVLLAPTTMYPIGGRVTPLPYELDPRVVPYLERVVPAALENQSRFLFVGRWRAVSIEPWLRERLAVRGFRSTCVGTYGNIGVWEFSTGSR